MSWVAATTSRSWSARVAWPPSTVLATPSSAAMSPSRCCAASTGRTSASWPGSSGRPRPPPQLNHPNVVAVFDYGQDPVGPYIVMELVTGGDLAGALRERGPLPPTVAASIAQQIADALDAAHARGIVHRDIKPSNVLLSTGGRVKVADFGIAQAFTDAQLTMTGVTMGSVHYFSPEQARGDPVGAPSDIYSAGLVLYEMLTGQRAFSGGSAAEVAMARLSGRIPTPAAVRPDVPMALDAIVRWALQPDPRARPSAAELSAALGRFLADPIRHLELCRSPHSAADTVRAVRAGPSRSRSCRRPAVWAGSRRSSGCSCWCSRACSCSWSSCRAPAGGPRPPVPLAPRPTAAVDGDTQAHARSRRPDSWVCPSTPHLLADRVGLLLEEEHRKTDEAPPGTVIEQDPALGSGSTGQHGACAGGPGGDTVTVPDVRGETEENAINRPGRGRPAARRAVPGVQPRCARGPGHPHRPPHGHRSRAGHHRRLLPVPGTAAGADAHRGADPRPRGQLPLRRPGPRAPADQGRGHGRGHRRSADSPERWQLAGPGPGSRCRCRGGAGHDRGP